MRWFWVLVVAVGPVLADYASVERALDSLASLVGAESAQFQLNVENIWARLRDVEVRVTSIDRRLAVMEHVCPAGRQMNGTVCVDVDECALGEGACAPGFECLNTDGSFVCVDVDECNRGTHTCFNAPWVFQKSPGRYRLVHRDAGNMTCVNTVGSFQCVCDADHFMDAGMCKRPFKSAKLYATFDTKCALALNTTDDYYCWGYAYPGVSGTQMTRTFGDESNSTWYEYAVAVPKFKGTLSVAVGRKHLCAVYLDGTLECWGQQVFRYVGMNFTKVACGAYANCGIRLPSRNIWCFGDVYPTVYDDMPPKRIDPPMQITSLGNNAVQLTVVDGHAGMGFTGLSTPYSTYLPYLFSVMLCDTSNVLKSQIVSIKSSNMTLPIFENSTVASVGGMGSALGVNQIVGSGYLDDPSITQVNTPLYSFLSSASNSAYHLRSSNIGNYQRASSVTTTTYKKVESNITVLASAWEHACGVSSNDNGLYCWGANSFNATTVQLPQFMDNSTFVGVFAFDVALGATSGCYTDLLESDVVCTNWFHTF